jgi:hypothetical protein
MDPLIFEENKQKAFHYKKFMENKTINAMIIRKKNLSEIDSLSTSRNYGL